MLTNAQLIELLARAAEDEIDHRQRALRRASRAALTWPVEVAELREEDESLTILPAVGPWVARQIHAWLDDPPEVPEPDPMRAGFMTMAEAAAILETAPAEWRTLRADLQVHTTETDGAGTMREMVEEAIALGYAYVAITDHSQGLKITNGMDEERLARQGEQIAALNEEVGARLRVLRGIEMNLSPEGEGDMDPDSLARLDLVLGAFHSKLRLTEDQTERYLAGVRNPTVDVLAHPRTRMFGRRLGLQADWSAVFTEAAALDVAVEIDASPDRQDLDVATARVAAESGCRITISTDAHHPVEMGFIDLGLATAVAAGVDPGRVVNMAPVEDCLAWTASRR